LELLTSASPRTRLSAAAREDGNAIRVLVADRRIPGRTVEAMLQTTPNVAN
jgi:hypothetical protein